MADTEARISGKGQTVIPKPVRERLGLKAGDLIRFRVDHNGTVTIEKVRQAVVDNRFATFSEWASEEDEKLYYRL